MKDTVQLIFTIGLVVAGIAYAVAQFSVARRRGSSDALTVALAEVDAIRVKADRLESEVRELVAAVESLKKENSALRSVLIDRDDFDRKLMEVITENFQKQTRRLVDVLRESRP